MRVGMRVAEVEAALGRPLGAAGDTASCRQVPLPTSASVLAMVISGRVVRLDIRDSSVATDRGVRIGDSEARVDSLYSGLTTRQKHKYTEGNYIIVTPAGDAGLVLRTIFETDGERVALYRVGLLPYVAWVEGCS